MKAKTNRSAAVYVAVVVVVVGALGLGTVSGMPPGIAVVAAVMLGFLIYVVPNAPSRYRRFGPGQQQEMIDNQAGIFGKTYPQDLVTDVQPPLEHMSRNDLCPCGSGKKYKHCHGV
jgi:hypothetical protein